MEKLKGYKTLLVGGLLVLYAVLGVIGVDIPTPDSEQALGVSGFLMVALRLITNGPVGGAK